MLPGQIENWNFIIDFNHMRVTDLPLSIIKTILRTLQTNFIGRLHRMYLINVTKTISFFWNIIKTFLEETTTYKISLFNNNLLENFYSYTNKCQTENCLGGDCPDLDENFWYRLLFN